MAPFVVLIVLFARLSVLGHFQLPVPYGWWTSLRLALSGMFLLTASAHWGKRRPGLIRMVPTVFPRPDLLVTVTGILEVLGAVGPASEPEVLQPRHYRGVEFSCCASSESLPGPGRIVADATRCCWYIPR